MRERTIIANATLDDYDSIVRIGQECFGDGWFLNRYQQNIFDPETGIIPLVAKQDGKVLGYCLSVVIDEKRLRSEFNTPPVNNEPMVGYLKMIAVTETARNQGLAGRMTRLSLEKLSKKVKTVYSDAWFDPRLDRAPFAPTLEKFGFTRSELIENFWVEELKNNPGLTCQACGDKCTCSAIIYYKTFN